MICCITNYCPVIPAAAVFQDCRSIKIFKFHFKLMSMVKNGINSWWQSSLTTILISTMKNTVRIKHRVTVTVLFNIFFMPSANARRQTCNSLCIQAKKKLTDRKQTQEVNFWWCFLGVPHWNCKFHPIRRAISEPVELLQYSLIAINTH